MITRARFVHRIYTTTELEAADRCLVCERATTRLRDADFGEGASTLYMTRPLPEVRLCETCDAAQHDAMRRGRRDVVISLVFAVFLVIVVSAAAPGASPFVVAAAGFVGVLLSRLVIAHVRTTRALASRLLFVDGAEAEVVLQLRLEGAPAEALPYRQESRTPRTDGVVVAKPVGPRVRATLAFIATTGVVVLASVIGGFGSYPVVVIDNPRSEAVVFWLDGGERVLVHANGRSKRTVAYGTHRLVGAGYDTSFRAPWGSALVVTTRTPPCFEVRGLVKTQPMHALDGAEGAIYVFDQGDAPTRAPCPRPIAP